MKIQLGDTDITNDLIYNIGVQEIGAVIDPIANFHPNYKAVLEEAQSLDAILPSPDFQRLQNDLVVELDSTGKWDMWDDIHIFWGNGDFIFRSINWKNPTGAKAIEVGVGTMKLSDIGMKGDNVNYVELNNSLSNYSLNDASFICDAVEGDVRIQADKTAAITRLSNSSTWQYLNSDDTNRAIFDGGGLGFKSFSRTGTSVKYHVDGSITGDGDVVFNSVSLPQESFTTHYNGSSSRSEGTIGFIAIGSSVHGIEASIYNSFKNTPVVTLTGGIPSDGFVALVFSGDYGTYDIPTTTFTFNKTTSLIEEGAITDLVAKNNRRIMTEAIRHTFETYPLCTTWKCDDTMDAFFNVNAGLLQNPDDLYAQSIQISYDNKTFDFGTAKLRVQPNKYGFYTLVGLWRGTNVTLENGEFYGDRFQHTYDPTISGSYDNGILIGFYGAKQCTLDGVKTYESIGDGFIIRSGSYSQVNRLPDGSPNPEGWYSEQITIKNSLFKNHRRNGLAFTDVTALLVSPFTRSVIDNCDFVSNGLSPLDEWNGQPPVWGLSPNGYTPRHAIDFEAITEVTDTGVFPTGTTVYNIREKIENVHVTNCRFIDNWADLDLYKCWDMEINDNYFEGAVGNVASYNINIHHNLFNFTDPSDGKDKVTAGAKVYARLRADGESYCRNWDINDNVFVGHWNPAIAVGGTDHSILRNQIVQKIEDVSVFPVGWNINQATLVQDLSNLGWNNRFDSLSLGVFKGMTIGDWTEDCVFTDNTVETSQVAVKGFSDFATNIRVFNTQVTNTSVTINSSDPNNYALFLNDVNGDRIDAPFTDLVIDNFTTNQDGTIERVYGVTLSNSIFNECTITAPNKINTETGNTGIVLVP